MEQGVDTREVRTKSRGWSLRRSLLTMRASFLFRSKNADKIRAFVEQARQNRIERSLDPCLMAEALIRFYSGFPDFIASLGAPDAPANQDEGRKLVFAFYANCDNRMRRKIMTYVLNDRKRSYHFTLIDDLVRAGFKIQHKDLLAFRAHVLADSRYRLKQSGHFRGEKLESQTWDRGLRQARRITIRPEVEAWLNSLKTQEAA